MKLLLTSAGLKNQSIVKALFELVGKKPEETSLVFIPTAANVEAGDKGWLIDDLIHCKEQNFKSIEITDIAAVGSDIWLPSLEQADVIFFGGGNPNYLMEQINTSGLAEKLPQLLETRVYAGISAGSMVTSPDMSLRISQMLYDEDWDRSTAMTGLNYVDFHVMPHLNSEYFTKITKENIDTALKGITEKAYALDDQSALKIIDGHVEVVSEGEWASWNI